MLLLIDLDNTLADRQAAFEYWMERKLAEWAPSDASARHFLIEHDQDGVRPRNDFLAAVRERFALETSVEVLLADYRDLTWLGFARLPAEIRDQLAVLRGAGWKVALVTNGESGVQERTAERVGVTPLLDACIVSGAVGVRKPDPRILELAAAACDEPLAGAWMVGDGEVDVLAANNAALRSAWISRGRVWSRSDCQPTLEVATVMQALLQIARA